MHVMTVDYQSVDAPAQVVESMKKTGFVILNNHPIPDELIYKSYEEWEAFFKQPESQKQKYLFKRDFEIVQDGFIPASVSETAKNSTQPDLKEFFHYYPKPHGRTPEGITHTQELREEMIVLAEQLLEWLEAGLPKTIRNQLSLPLRDMVDKEQQSLLRILHYPPLQIDNPRGAMRAAEHEDINLITLLPAATASGLQAKDLSGQWHSIQTQPNQLIINCGDMLQEASRLYYHATPHRVVNPDNEDAYRSRYSMPFFLHPRSDVQLSERYTARSYLNERLEELGLR